MENRRYTGRQTGSYMQRYKRVPSRYQVEIAALISSVCPTTKHILKYKEKDGKIIEKEWYGEKREKRVMLKTHLFFYSSEEHENHENQDVETQQTYKRLKHVRRGDFITICFLMADFEEFFPQLSSNNLIRHSGANTIKFEEFVTGKYPFQIDNILIDKCTFCATGTRHDIPIGLTRFNFESASKISRLWTYTQSKFPLIPKAQYHFIYKYIPIELKVKRYISIGAGIFLLILTLFPTFLGSPTNQVLRVILTLITIFKEFL